MPSKSRWTLNPRKWFGSITNTAHNRNKKVQINNAPTPSPSKTVTKTMPSTSTVSRLLPTRNKTKVIPVSPLNDNNYANSRNTAAYLTQLQLSACNVRRENTSLLLSSSTLFNRTTNLPIVPRTEPSIRKGAQFNEELSFDATQWQTHMTVNNTSKFLISSQYRNVQQRNLTKTRSQVSTSNLSEQGLIDYPQSSLNNFMGKCSSTIRTHSPSCVDDIDDDDESSSSGIFTDERADFNDHPRTASKDTLSTIEVLSIESIVDSQTSLNHEQSRPTIHHYRLPISTYETIDNKETQSQRQTPSYRPRSAEGSVKDDLKTNPKITKIRQSSAAIVKKIEKPGFVRVANDTYRLTIVKDEHLYRRQRRKSVIRYSTYDDSLPSANNEESYATLPRTSSTDQLEYYLQNDLRTIVDDYLRPVVNSVNLKNDQLTKAQHRSKRSYTNLEHKQIKIDDLTDKLLSSIDYSVYTQYQRCY